MQLTKMLEEAAPQVWQQINCPFPEGRADLKSLKLPWTKEVIAVFHCITCSNIIGLSTGMMHFEQTR